MKPSNLKSMITKMLEARHEWAISYEEDNAVMVFRVKTPSEQEALNYFFAEHGNAEVLMVEDEGPSSSEDDPCTAKETISRIKGWLKLAEKSVADPRKFLKFLSKVEEIAGEVCTHIDYELSRGPTPKVPSKGS